MLQTNLKIELKANNFIFFIQELIASDEIVYAKINRNTAYNHFEIDFYNNKFFSININLSLDNHQLQSSYCDFLSENAKNAYKFLFDNKPQNPNELNYTISLLKKYFSPNLEFFILKGKDFKFS